MSDKPDALTSMSVSITGPVAGVTLLSPGSGNTPAQPRPGEAFSAFTERREPRLSGT